MDYLWTPWRYAYITTADTSSHGGTCVFCELLNLGDDAKALIVHRAQYNFVVLNAFPYTSGHSMIVPYEHVDRLHKLPQAAAVEMMDLARRLELAFLDLYHPDGVNIGMNIQLVPITGIPLPFVSYGGTFLVACLAAMGLVQSVWVHRKNFDRI